MTQLRRAASAAVLAWLTACASSSAPYSASSSRAVSDPRSSAMTVCTGYRKDGDSTIRDIVGIRATGAKRPPPDYYTLIAAGDVGTRVGFLPAYANQRSGSVRAEITANGDISDIRIDSAGDIPALDSAVVAAFKEAEKQNAFEFPPLVRPAGPTMLTVTMSFRKTENPLYDAFGPPAEAVAPMPGNPLPEYPRAEARSGVGATLTVQLFIQRSGRPHPTQFRILDPRFQGFVSAIAAVLPRYRYYPAQSGGCAVQLLVRQPFTFALSR